MLFEKEINKNHEMFIILDGLTMSLNAEQLIEAKCQLRLSVQASFRHKSIFNLLYVFIQ